MKANSLVVLAVALAALLVAAVVFAQQTGYGWGGHMGMGHMWSNAPEDVRLSEAQLEKIDRIRDSYAKQFAAVRDEVRDLNVAIANELSKDEPNSAKLKSLREQRVIAYEKLDNLQDRMHKEIDNVLTEKQREYYGRYGIDEMGPYCMCRYGRGGHMGGGMMGYPHDYRW